MATKVGEGQQPVWIEFEGEFIRGTVAENALAENEHFVDVAVEQLGVTIPIRKADVFLANTLPPDGVQDVGDLTSLRHLHEPAIVEVLRERSYEDLPYTYLSGILVSVNPLEDVEEALEPGFSANQGDVLPPHPYALSERSFQQLCFAAKNGKPCAQSIVIAGESGAGKTEISKRVLQHLIARSTTPGSDLVEQDTQDSASAASTVSIDEQLLGINPILESFGNASTLRNHNSSRFGKFTKLHFACGDRDSHEVKLVYASICSYLLERSRISCHSPGERSFRAFYEMLHGADAAFREMAGLEGSQTEFPGYGFRYLTPLGSDSAAAGLEEDDFEALKELDAEAFESLNAALSKVGLGKDAQDIFGLLAGVLHLGNITFSEKESEQGVVSQVHSTGPSRTALQFAAQLMGVEEAPLENLLCERVVNLPGGEQVSVQRKIHESAEARDALAKSLYSALFDWLIEMINHTLAPEAAAKTPSLDQSYVGVLDIFGFETFAKNDFEQLLINFANEALQETFHQQILVAEARLYREEGLLVDEEDTGTPSVAQVGTGPQDTCLRLLSGDGTKSSPGILQLLEAESECPNPKDEKFLHALHARFETNPNFLPPHPKDRRSTFIVQHYATTVTYTIGSFTHKNLDRLPKDARGVLGLSSKAFLKSVVSGTSDPNEAPAGNKKRQQQQKSIVFKFTRQISTLVDDLESTQCSFVRCIKPNLSMSRDHDDGQWFDTHYALDQMRALGIPQTAKALRGGGFPTRIDYKDVMHSFQSQLPQDVAERCVRLVDIGSCSLADQSSEALLRRRNARLIRALFWAYDIPATSYRCGMTKVFFKAGALEEVDAILQTASPDDAGGHSEAPRKLKYHCAMSAWRLCFAKVRTCNRFKHLLGAVRDKAAQIRQRLENDAAVRIQALVRSSICFFRYRSKYFAIMNIQSYWRAFVTRRDFNAQLQRMREERERQALQMEQQEQLQKQIRMYNEQMDLLKEQAALRQQCAEASARIASEQHDKSREEPKSEQKEGGTVLSSASQYEKSCETSDHDATESIDHSGKWSASEIASEPSLVLDTSNDDYDVSTDSVAEEGNAPVPPLKLRKSPLAPAGAKSLSSGTDESSDVRKAANCPGEKTPGPPLPPKPSHKRGAAVSAVETENSNETKSSAAAGGEDLAVENLKQAVKSFRLCESQRIVAPTGIPLPPPVVNPRNMSMRAPRPLSSKSAAGSISAAVAEGQQLSSLQPPPPPPKSARTIKRQSVRAGSMKLSLAAKTQLLTGSSRSSWRQSTREDVKKQRTIFLRLRQEERSYVDALSIINGNYFQPLSARISLEESSQPGVGKILKTREVGAIFSNLTQLLQLHTEMLSSIERGLVQQKENPEYDLALGFIQNFKDTLPFLRTIYAVYVKQHCNSLNVLFQCRSNTPKFAKFLRATAENKNLPSYGTDLRDLLKIPINQISRYNEFLHMLLSCTHPENEVHVMLRESCKAIELISKDLDEERRLSRLSIRAYEIATQLEGFSKSAWKRKGASQLFHNSSKATRHHSLMSLSQQAEALASGSSCSSDNTANGGGSATDANKSSAGGSAGTAGNAEAEALLTPENHILVPGRSFLGEWAVPLTVIERALQEDDIPDTCKPKDRTFFIFSDVLIVAKRTAATKFDLRMWMDLSEIWVDNSHLSDPSTKTGKMREAFGVTHQYRGERVFPLKVVYVSAEMASNAAGSDKASSSLANLRGTNLSRIKARRLSSAKKRANKTAKKRSRQPLAPKVENLIMWFHSPSQRREVYNLISSSSQNLKLRREQLTKMQRELAGKGRSASPTPLHEHAIPEDVEGNGASVA